MATMAITVTKIFTDLIPKLGEIVLKITIATTTKNIKDEKYKRKTRSQNGNFCLTLACPDNKDHNNK